MSVRSSAVSLLLLGMACGHGVAAPPRQQPKPREQRTPRQRIVFILLENRGYGSVTPGSMPFLTSEASNHVRLTNSYAITHPSLPNYMTLMAGDTFFSSNCDVTERSCRTDATNIMDQLDRAGLTWKGYMEDMPSPCYRSNASGDYVAKHDPFLHYNDIWSDTTRCNLVVPLTQLTTDLKNNALPSYAFIVPGLCNDAHNCGLSIADAFLAHWVPQIEARLGPTGVIFVTFDEGTSNDGCCHGIAGGGHIYTAILGPGAKASTTISTGVDAYSLLAAVESNWNLGLLGGAASAPVLGGWES